MTIHLFSKTAETGERVVRENTQQMVDHIAVVIVFGGPNQDNGQAFARDSLWGGLSSHDVEYSHTHKFPDQLTGRSCGREPHLYGNCHGKT